MFIRIVFIFFVNLNCMLFAYDYDFDINNVESIPLEKKISQMLLVGFSGSEFSEELISYIKTYNIGGVVYFNKSFSRLKKTNILSYKQIIDLNKDIQNNSSIPSFIGIADDVSLPSNLEMDLNYSFSYLFSDKINDIYDESLKIAKKLKHLGFNLDINNNISNSIVDYSVFYKNISKYLNAYKEVQIMKSINYTYSIHNTKPSSSFTDISQYELLEEEAKINFFHKNIINSIILPNAINNNIDSKYPASLSTDFINKLKTTLEYQGLIITSDLKNRSMSLNYSLDEALIMAINSGSNIIFYSNNVGKYNAEFVKNAISIIKQNVINGNIDIQKINDSYIKILQIKKQLKI